MTALLGKSVLLIRIGREDESIATCDALVRRFETHTEMPIPLLVVAAFCIKGMVLSKKDSTLQKLWMLTIRL